MSVTKLPRSPTSFWKHLLENARLHLPRTLSSTFIWKFLEKVISKFHLGFSVVWWTFSHWMSHLFPVQSLPLNSRLKKKKKQKTKGMIIQFSDINMVFPLNCITVTNTDISQKKHHLPFCITSTFLGKWQLYQVPFQVFSDTHIPCLLSEHCIHHLFVLCFSVFLSFPSYETCFTLTRLFLQTTK